MNVARMAWFSSDRTIAEYAEEIWDVPINGQELTEKLRAKG
jgi:starch phosphorylase